MTTTCRYIFLRLWLKTPFVSTKFCDLYTEMVQDWQILMFYTTIVDTANDYGHKICVPAKISNISTHKNSHLKVCKKSNTKTVPPTALQGVVMCKESEWVTKWESERVLYHRCQVAAVLPFSLLSCASSSNVSQSYTWQQIHTSHHQLNKHQHTKSQLHVVTSGGKKCSNTISPFDHLWTIHTVMHSQKNQPNMAFQIMTV